VTVPDRLAVRRREEKWETLFDGLRRKGSSATPGPWFQYRDAVGFEWNTFEVILPDLPAALDGFRLIHLSDLHCQTYWQTAYDELVDRLRLDEPQLIVISGDIVDDIKHPKTCLPTALKLLEQLRAVTGVIGIQGNHDEKLDPIELNGTPLRLIDGRRIFIEYNGAKIELIAPPGPLRSDYPPGFETNFPAKTPGIPRIIVSHYPDHFRKLRVLKPDLFLCGHTHGGQVCLPGRIPILRHDSLPIKYFLGTHRIDTTLMFINRGFGFSTFPFRVFCPSEVIEIRLRRSAE
jgi:predicted MPP superfamily phosphohydrolase